MVFTRPTVHSKAVRALLFFVSVIVWAGTAQAQSGVALPAAGEVYLWDMTDAASIRKLTGPLPEDMHAGTCYGSSNGALVAESDEQGCLSYYVYEDVPLDVPHLVLSGYIAFNDRAPDLRHRGLELRDVSGVASCGEREACDTLYIVGFESAALVGEAMSAARSGQQVALGAWQVWNMESLDLVVDAIEIVD